MTEAERVARAICKDRGIDPDRKVFLGQPEIVSGMTSHYAVAFYEPDPLRLMPVWQLFEAIAEVAIANIAENNPTR